MVSITPVKYRINNGPQSRVSIIHSDCIEARDYDEAGNVIAWAVVSYDEVLNKSGEWEWEPQPSSRTDEFKKRTRFATTGEALNAYVGRIFG
jgi:hypothetical protein